MPGRFLSAHWSYLVMLNYEVPPEILEPHVPRGTELDFFDGRAMVSMVGFLFRKTKLKGVPIPFHRHFEEVNLRFYVRRIVGGETRRGVVFIKEIVPRPALAWVARAFYNENYVALKMDHQLALNEGLPSGEVCYRWRFQNQWCRMAVTPTGQPSLPRPGEEPEFITEHYWGYAAQKDGGTLEYRVAHPTWRVWQAESTVFECDVAALYGEAFAEHLAKEPSSAFLAEGSDVEVFQGVRIG
jgi:hypothetical protein